MAKTAQIKNIPSEHKGIKNFWTEVKHLLVEKNQTISELIFDLLAEEIQKSKKKKK